MYSLIKSGEYMKNWHNRILEMTRFSKSLILIACDFLAIIFGLWSAFALRFSEIWPSAFLNNNWLLFILVPLLGVLTFYRLGFYHAVMRYMTLKIFQDFAFGVIILTLFIYSFSYISGNDFLPRSVPLIFGLSAWLYLSCSRLFIRGYYNWLTGKISNRHNVIIYGAGKFGAQLAVSLQTTENFHPVAFVDDNQSKNGINLCGVRIHSSKTLENLIKQLTVETVLIAIENLPSDQRTRILRYVSQFPVKVKIVPSTDEIIKGEDISKLRPININDVLGRDIVNSKTDLLNSVIKNRCICVTGAGGSIGSELARQALYYRANTIVLYEISEHALYEIENELLAEVQSKGLKTNIYAVLGSVNDEYRIHSVFTLFKVETVLHAAAYKHVPMVERNVLQGLQNNTLGTWIAANAASRAQVERFMLISSDKAVRPTNVMGATKRFAELCIQSLAKHSNSKTIFSMVRFGNVLGSSGSVIPIFEKQIKRGGPVTVTHPDINRYFMTISEAVNLVIQACAMAKGGEVFLLDMGQPVKIVDLAKSMIRLSGLQVKDRENPNGDVEIVFTGLRPGEKLFEELLIEETVIGTQHPMIMQAKEAYLSEAIIDELLKKASQAISRQDTELGRAVLQEAVTEFKPSSFNIDLLKSFSTLDDRTVN